MTDPADRTPDPQTVPPHVDDIPPYPPDMPETAALTVTQAPSDERIAANGAAAGDATGTGTSGGTGSGATALSRDRHAEFRTATEQARLWGPPLPLGSRPRRAWREQVEGRAAELAVLAAWMENRTDGPSTAAAGPDADAGLDVGIRGHLDTARDAARGLSFWRAARGARMERAFTHLDAAETALLRRAPDAYLRGQLPALTAHVRAHLPPSHPERVRAEKFAEKRLDSPIDDCDRETLVNVTRVASSAARREHIRLRSFRNVVLITTVAMAVLAGGIALVSANQPTWIPLCFAPQGLDKVVCPTQESALTGNGGAGGTVASEGIELDAVVAQTAQGHDVALVMLLGLAAAAVTGAAALRRIRGSSTPFAVPMALVALKLPTGALTAVLGLLLLGGGFVPGLSALDSSGQILAWALIFGAAQQLVTGVVDRQAQSVLDSVGSAPMTAEKE